MKRILFITITLIVVCFLFFQKEEIRIRVIGNSDSENDIKEKEEVVKYLNEFILKDQILTEEYFINNSLMIEEKLNEKFSDIKVSYEKHTFYNKSYNGSVLNDGTYQTLLIRIKEAKGSNWWSSVFDGKIHSGSNVDYVWFFKNGW